LGYAGALSERAQLLRRGDTGVLKVAAPPVTIEPIVAPFLPRYAQRYPNVQVKVTEAVGTEVLALLERGEAHLGMALRPLHGDDGQFGTFPVPSVGLVAASAASLRLARGRMVDITRLSQHPLLLLDSSFVIRRTFDAVCRLAKVKPNIVLESRVPSNLLAFAEAGHGVAVIPSAVPTHRYALRVVRIKYERKPVQEPFAVVWDKRRVLPRYAQDFCELLAAYLRQQLPRLARARTR